MRGKRSKKKFYENFISIGLPLVVQQFLNSSLNFLDNIMMGKLGAQYIAGVGFANNIYKIQDICLFGICGGVGVFISQYYGKKDFKTIKRLIGVMMFGAVTLSLFILIVSQVFTKEIIHLFSKDTESIKIGISYLKLSSYSYILSAIGFTLVFSLRCMGKTKVTMISAAIGVVVNGILNYLLIYGKLGFPALNEKGAAIATLIARGVQMWIILHMILKYDYGIKGKIREYLGVSKKMLQDIVKIATPIFLTEVFWILGTVTLTIAYSRIGVGEAASIQIADLILSIAAIMFMGISNASSVIIGKSIGEGKKKLAKLHSSRALKIAGIFSALTVFFLQLIITPLLSFYTLTPEIYKMAESVLRVFGVVIFFKLVNWTILIGILRAGGDTKIAFYLDTAPLYLYAIPAAFLTGYLGLPIYLVVGIANIEEVVKCYFSIKRYRTMRWVNDLTK